MALERLNVSLRCSACARSWPLDPTRWRCDCGGVLELVGAPSFDPTRVDGRDYTLWRYQAALPLPDGATPATLGEGWTPLIAAEWNGQPLYLKAEHLNPTGSFKDRGAAVLVTALKAAGVRGVVEDSSGNAGAALAAYAAHAGLRATVYVPAHASPIKQAQIAVYGAEVVPVPGPRSEAARAVRQAAEKGAVYASHAYSPFYPQGMKTVAFELWEQLDGHAPESVVLPLGHGGLLLGLHRGFSELLAAGLIERLPRLFGVQAQPCAPLARAWERGATDVEPVEEQETVAEGVRIAAPPWGRAILAAVRESGGAVLALQDSETLAAQRKLAKRGVYVEPTSALAVAALDHLRDRLGDVPVVVLTGSGFKSPPPTANWQRRVAAFARHHNLLHDPTTHALDLVSEVGEVAKEVLLAADLEALQQALGYRFRDPNFLLRALTHPSYVHEHPEDETGDNQRLEFLGDAVLDFIAGAWVYRHYPDFAEGRMTRLRAALVCARTLARLARQVGIGEALRLGHGEEGAGGRERDANLCDAFEAVVGALYLDGGLAAAEAFVEPLIGPVAEAILAAEADLDAKSRLQEWSQAELGVTPRYRTAAEKGPDHAKTFEVEVLLGKKVAGRGTGRSKQVAEQAAAQAAWESLVRQGAP